MHAASPKQKRPRSVLGSVGYKRPVYPILKCSIEIEKGEIDNEVNSQVLPPGRKTKKRQGRARRGGWRDWKAVKPTVSFLNHSLSFRPQPDTCTYSLVFLIFWVSLIKVVIFTFTHAPLALVLDIDFDWIMICCQFFQYSWNNEQQAQVAYPSSLLYIKSHGLEGEF